MGSCCEKEVRRDTFRTSPHFGRTYSRIDRFGRERATSSRSDRKPNPASCSHIVSYRKPISVSSLEGPFQGHCQIPRYVVDMPSSSAATLEVKTSFFIWKQSSEPSLPV